MGKVFSYRRLSTSAQLAGHGGARQLEAAERWAAERGLELADDASMEEVVSAFRGKNVATGSVLGDFLGAVRTGKVPRGSVLVVENLDRVSRDRACIFMSNHVSNLDPPALISLIPGRTSAFMKRSLMRLPILGTGFRQGEFVAVDRSGDPADAERSVVEAQRVLMRGVHMTTFVEGTRSPDGRMLPFKKGPFFLAMASGAPCIPVSIHGTETILRKGNLRIHPGVANVIFHQAIDPAAFATREELMHAVRPAIASGLPEWMRT